MSSERDRHAARLAGMQDASLDIARAQKIQRDLPDDEVVEYAFRRLVFTIGEPPDAELGPMEAAVETADHVRELSQRVAELEDEVDELRKTVETALTLAEQQADDGNVTKQRAARITSRDELVRRGAMGEVGGGGAHLTVPEVQEMLKPEVRVHYQTVKDAWTGLEADWSAFHVGENEAGENALKLDWDAVDRSLGKAVERSLDRDGLTKRLLSRQPEGGS